MKIVYISSPMSAKDNEELRQNCRDAINFCEKAYNRGQKSGDTVIPFSPLINFPYLDSEETRKMGLMTLTEFDEVWFAGQKMTDEMRQDLRIAVQNDIPVMAMDMNDEKLQQEIDELPPLLDEFDCIENSDKFDYEGELLVLKPSALATWAAFDTNQLWEAQSGFGLDPNSSGRAVYATSLYDGTKERWNREDFCGIIDSQNLPEWAKEKLKERQSENTQNDENTEEQEESEQ